MRAHDEHGDGQLRNERKVERDAIAALDAERLEDVGKCADLTIEIPVGQRPPIARLAFPDKCGFVAPSCADVPIEAVDADIELAAGEPLRVRRMPLEDRVPRAASIRARSAKPAQKPSGSAAARS